MVFAALIMAWLILQVTLPIIASFSLICPALESHHR